MPTPTSEQIESVPEIARLASYAEAESKINVLNDAQWAATISDITEWAKIKNKFTRIEGGRSGVFLNKEDNRLAICNRVRIRLGLPEIDEYGMPRGGESIIFSSCSVKTKAGWKEFECRN